jgi:hypothetical protein
MRYTPCEFLDAQHTSEARLVCYSLYSGPLILNINKISFLCSLARKSFTLKRQTRIHMRFYDILVSSNSLQTHRADVLVSSALVRSVVATVNAIVILCSLS